MLNFNRKGELRSKGYIDIHITSDARLLELDAGLYVLSKEYMKFYNFADKKFYNVTGFEPSSDFVSARVQSEPGMFYVLTENGVTFYKLTTPTSLVKIKRIEDIGFKGSRAMASIYTHPYLYVSGE